VEVYRGVKAIEAESPAEWRRWLNENSQTEESVWLIIYRKNGSIPSVTYDEAVDQALCFGWIDSKINKRDERSHYQYFARRNPGSNWSRVNKEKVERLLASGEMAAPGLKMIDHAKKTGTWTALDDVENLKIPEDLAAEFGKYDLALEYWNGFPRSAKRGILEWIFNAKRAETRAERISETALKASKNERANQYIRK
jgi:uncharacterized protein YdeI (YjbR/CyaY-like superfamily)